MKIYASIICILFGMNAVHPQTNIDTTTALLNLKSTAQKMVEYLHERDYNDFAKYTHPKIIAMIGGKEKMAEAIEASFKQIKDGGFDVDSVSVGEPGNLVITKTELQDVIPEILQMRGNNGRLVATSYLLSVSNDKGKTWYFIDTSGKTLQQMQVVFPELSNKLVIPAKQQPTFYKN